jgi:hypothetical protein
MWHAECFYSGEAMVGTGYRLCLINNIKKHSPNLNRRSSMKMKQLAVVCGLAVALLFSVGTVSAQDNGGGGGGQGGQGGGGFNRGGGGRGNFDPAQFQQRIMDNVTDQLGFTNDTDWEAVQPLVQKVMDARREVGGGNMMRLFRGNRGGQGGGNRRPNPFGATNPDADALQKALDDNAPSGQVKELLARYEASQKTRQATLKDSEENLRQVLNSRQEAQATLLGLLD